MVASLRHARRTTFSTGGRTFAGNRSPRSAWPGVAEIVRRSPRASRHCWLVVRGRGVVMREPQETPTRSTSRSLERVAAVDVAKAWANSWPVRAAPHQEVKSFQCPSETTSTLPSVTLMAVWSSIAYVGAGILAAHCSAMAMSW
jgi:hypothetical protein